MNKKKTTELIVALVLTVALCLGIAGISAYFTDADTATNTFTIGEISLDLQEPSWVGNDNAKDIVPMQTIAKDPQILNDGVNDEFVFMTVAVPYANIVTANDDGTKNAAADTELFNYTVDSAWVEIGTSNKDTAKGVVVHTYAYGTDAAMTRLVKGAKTPALFSSVTFANAIEDEGLEKSSKDIVINAYGIQADNINGGKTAPTDVWSVISNQAPSTSVGVTENSVTDIKNAA